MGKKQPGTPRSRVRNAFRNLWLRSRERAAALKREDRRCQRCGIKESSAVGKEVKLEVHHRNGINWEEIVDLVFEKLLCDPKDLEVMCKRCHSIEHNGEQ